MVVLTKSKIKSLATNVKTYMRGVEYYRAGAVQNLQISPDEMSIRAVVQGNRRYHVAMDFSDGDFGKISCDCPAYKSYQGACKHGVAVLLKLMDERPVISLPGSTDLEEDDKKPHSVPLRYDPRLAMSHAMVSTIVTDARLKQRRRPINLRATLFIESTTGGKTHVDLEIGENRLYIVQRIGEFLDAIRFGRELYFGKTFTFNPQVHYFRPGDQRFIDWLLPIYLDESGPFYASKYAKRSFTIPPSRLRHFLKVAEAMEDATWKSPDQGGAHPFLVQHGLPPTALSMVRRQGEIMLEFWRESPIYSVTPLNDVLLMGDTFYLPDQAEQKVFSPIIKAFARDCDGKLPISQEDAAVFIAEGVPVLKSICPVEIESGILEALHHEALVISIWLDRCDQGITAKVEFAYGQRIINPLLTATGEYFMVRETVKEERCLQLLMDAGFMPNGEYYILLNEEKIYDLLHDKLSALIEIAEVYYSEAFRNLQIRRPPRLNGGIRWNEQADLLEVDFQLEEFDAEDLYALLQALREKKRFFRLRDQSFIALDQPETLAIGRLLAELGVTSDGFVNKRWTLPKYKALYLHDVARELGNGQLQLDDSLQQLVQKIEDPKLMAEEVPPFLSGVLRDYQKTGFKWLKALSQYGFGGILADDMGLGKTLQVITLVASDWESSRQPSLVVAPTSLLYNWQEEIEKFAPQLPTLVINGTKRIRRELWKRTREAAFVITSYPLLRRDVEEVDQSSFAYCFIDEAQHIKNPETINAKSVKQVNARHYFALTGTPIENSLTELWSIFDFIMPGYLGSHSIFQQKYETPIVRNNDLDALEDLKLRIRHFILRRLKRDVLEELPEKTETKLVCEMTERQKKVYAAYLSQARSELEKEIQARGFQRSRVKILSLLTRLRQICCHPAAFLENYTGDSGKLETLREIIVDSLDSGHRILIFSQFVTMLDLIEKEIKLMGKRFYRIDGSTPPGMRIQQVHAFNEGEAELFLISLKAGGTGLNLTGADTVIHYDPWWNPAVEDQATDRAYRIGQLNKVQVYKLVTRGTIEEKIYVMQQRKRDLVEAVIKPGESFLGKMTPEEIRSLFE